MTIKTVGAKQLGAPSDALVLPLFANGQMPPWGNGLPESTRALVSDVLARGEFDGKWKKSLLFRPAAGGPYRWLLLVGLGEQAELSLDRLRQACGIAARAAREARASDVRMPLIVPDGTAFSARSLAQAHAEGFLLSLYQFLEYKTDEDANKHRISRIELVPTNGASTRTLNAGVHEGTVISECACFARDLAAYPGNVATPTMLASRARAIARSSPLMKVKVFGEAQIKRLGMGALAAVAQGSAQPPRFIVLEYRGDGKKSNFIALVGKGITFDSGGISLKPSKGLEEMKYDMSGGGAVLGVMRALPRLRIKRNVVGIIPATENLPGGTALKPGDILSTYAAKTIEVVNTDAEGRLILADALAYAVRTYRPEAVVDLATLTGSCVVGLGQHVSGLVSNAPELVEKLKRAGDITGERVWELPLFDEDREQIKSDIADMKNVGGRWGGAITAAALLEKFVDDTPWAHLDIAGTAYNDKDQPYVPKGPSGVGVRLIVQLLRAW